MQPSLFQWQDVEFSEDILRFRLALQALDDDRLLEALEAGRKGRRDDYPLRAVWNASLAGLFFGHETVTGLIRELRRNAELRQICGFDPLRGADAAPPPHVFSRLGAKLMRHQDLLDDLFDSMVAALTLMLPGLGAHLAADGKAIPACHKGDTEAAEGHKTQTDADGVTRRTMSWFGYKLHLICDAVHELPLAFEVTAANVHDSPRLIPLVGDLAGRHPELIERAETLAADKGYDDGEDKAALYDEHGIKPLIPPRDLHKGRPQPLEPQRHDTIYVTPAGEVCCRIDPMATGENQQFCAMQFQGFEKDRAAQKFRCPAAAFGVECKNRAACASRTKDAGFGRVVRVPIGRNRRLHGPVYVGSREFEEGYKRRTSVERLFFRLDHLYGMERHTARGLARVRVRITMALSAMLATAAAWIELGRAERIRSRLQAA